MSKKGFSTIGMLAGLAAVILGVVILAGGIGSDTSTPSSASYLYDSGYASFGADFYTYVSNNAAEAASASRTSAYNLYAIGELMKVAFGAFFVVFGLFMLCLFGIKRAESTAVEAPVDSASTEAIPEAAEAAPGDEQPPEHPAESQNG